MKSYLLKLGISIITASCFVTPSNACTGITLRANDGAVVFGRTMEWGTFDLNSRLVLIPRGYEIQSKIGDGEPGLTWKTIWGTVGLDAIEKDFLLDGMNEKGLSINAFYHPGFAKYPEVNPDRQPKTIEAVDIVQFLLTTCKNIEEVRKAMLELYVIGTVEPAIGIAPPIHFIATDSSGKAIIVEFVDNEVQLFEAPLGCITNAPAYDWHLTNLRNYLNLSHVALPAKRIENMDFAPLGGGSGMIGLPGDNTPPSRFVRAVAATQTARQTETGEETMYELFRILDNFNLPLGSAEGGGEASSDNMRSSTIWTTGYDTRNLVMQYHTMHNRRIRQIDLKKIDFTAFSEPIRIALDAAKTQDIDDVTPIISSP
ncbi:MAG: choloylglycine hydrolase family protein [Verrucomicrobiales bacterium]|nr:choloylglycine hydrolase family protein [Verrucomicrobiales bacterium]